MEVTMPTASIDRSVSEYVASFSKIEELQNEARDLLVKIKDIYLEIGEIANGGGRPARVGRPVGRPRGRRPGRPKGSVGKAKVGRPRGRPRGRPKGSGRKAVGRPRKATRAPRGALKAAIHKVLEGGKPMRPVEIVKALKKTGWKTKSKPTVFYSNVFLSCKKDGMIQKTKEGFKLRGASA
jgi:hypothetical protein